MEFSQINEYLLELAHHEDPVLNRLEAEAKATRFPIIGPAAGRLCYLVARLMQARTVFEMGSGFGYSTLWFARAVRDNGGGKVYHTVWDADLSARARKNFDEAGLSHLVQFHVGEAVAALRETTGPFDLIFNDIEKADYPASLPVIMDKLRPGGVLIVDNMLWHGAIFDSNDQSPATEGVRSLTRAIFSDARLEPVLIPIRDGLIVARKA